MSRAPELRKVAWIALMVVLAYGSFRTLWPFATAIVLGGWGAHLARPLFRRLCIVLGGRQWAAALLTVGLLVILAAPVVLAVATVVPTAKALLEEVKAAGGGREALAALVQDAAGAKSAGGIVDLVKEHGASASKIGAVVAGSSLQAVVGVFVFCVAFFASLVDGPRLSRWLEQNAPIDEDAVRRLRDAFFQAGRGLLVGNGLTALVQGAIATITYFALGVPRALLLGLLSVVGALIPVTGPIIVWLPVCIGLLVSGEHVKAAILAAVGVFVVGTVDNLLRPYLARRAHIGLDTSVVLVAMLGGIAFFGAWGLLLGPLAVRLTVEAFEIARDRGLGGRSAGA